MAYGSPSSPEDIRPYLEDIREGRPVSDEAVEELTERYRRIGGRSPLDEITERQRAALERELGLPVHLGMKHWRPRIREAADSAVAGGATRVLGLVLAPHYSRLSIAGYRERLEKVGVRFCGLSPDGLLPEIIELPEHPWFIGVQFHPELKSRPFEPHPLFASFIGAAVEQSRLV